MSNEFGPVAREYIAGVVASLEADLGTALPVGTTIVPDDERAGSNTAVAYLLPGQTALWCDPAVVERLAPLAGPTALTIDELLERSAGEPAGAGNNRVAEGTPNVVTADTSGLRVQWLDRSEPGDVALLAHLLADVSDDDAEEAELDLDDLDPAIVAYIDASDDAPRIAAYAGARPSDLHAGFDDIAVMTHPDHRRRNLGAAIVAHFAVERQHQGRYIMYRCDVENTASNALAAQLGFPLIHQVAAVRFAD